MSRRKKEPNDENNNKLVPINKNEDLDVLAKAVDIPNLPDKINNQFQLLENLGTKIENNKNKAKNSKKMADEAKMLSAGLLKKKAAIEEIQKALSNVADAVYSGAEANSLLFDNQRQISEIIQGLFKLGLGSIAMNRTVVRQLELQLKNAPKGKMADLVRKESENLLYQLKAQQSILHSLEILDNTRKDHHDHIFNLQEEANRLNNKDNQQDTQITKIEQDLALLNDTLYQKVEDIQRNLNKIKSEIDKDIEKLNNTATLLSNETSSHSENIRKIKYDIASQDEKNRNQAEILVLHENELHHKEQLINDHTSVIISLGKELSDYRSIFEEKIIKLAYKEKRDVIIAYIIGAAGVILGAISLFV